VKRAEALRPLSREHQVALAVAKMLREASDRNRAGLAFLDFWEEDGRRHFRIEEEVLLPTWALHAEVDRAGAGRMLEEHLAIRRAALRIADGTAPLEELQALGALLHDHVRFEERELFPLVEAALDADSLAQLAAAIERAEAA
jgi:hemerythrin-like domain-containing protein